MYQSSPTRFMSNLLPYFSQSCLQLHVLQDRFSHHSSAPFRFICVFLLSKAFISSIIV